MKNYTFILLTFLSYFPVQSQNIDTLIDVGGYNMHFNIIKGEGTPILFEAGGGNDGSIWNNILESIHEVTGATLITYDRSGFGKSELNPNETDSSKFGIKNGMQELESALKILGYDGSVILVSHSYGNFYTTLFASRHPENVKSMIMIDGNHVGFFPDEYIEKHIIPNTTMKYGLGTFYLMHNFPEAVKLMRQTKLPASIPVIDLIAGNPFSFMNMDEWELVLTSHAEFVDTESNRTGITAYGSNHYIFKDNPALVINTIIKAYSETVNEEQRNNILIKAIDNAIDLSIEAKKIEMERLHSESDFNSWGFQLMASGQLMKAIEVFKLNVTLFPESANVYDSYGESLMNANRDEKAIEMYEKSIALNPDNENGKKMLKKIIERK